METLNNLYMQVINISKTSPVLAGVISLWGMAVLTFLLRNVPACLVDFLSRQVTTSLELNNSGWGANTKQFNSFMEWYSKTPYFKWSRYLSLESTYVYREDSMRDTLVPVIGPGYGRHFFVFNGSFYWFDKKQLESQGTEKEKQSIKIHTFGRDKNKIFNLIDSFRVKEDTDGIFVYVYNKGWDVLTSVKKRDLNSVVINKDLKQKLVGNIQHFYENPEWYSDRGFAHKQTYMLHGKPGTGKSSTIKALASHFGKNICILDMDSITGPDFERAVATAPKGSFILLEDFDSCGATSKRGAHIDILEGHPSISLSKILNVLDGVVSLDGAVVFMTTNHLDHLDPALVRTGRVDYCYEIPLLGDAEVKDYIALMYGKDKIPRDKVFNPITGSDLQSAFMEAKEDFELFTRLLVFKEA